MNEGLIRAGSMAGKGGFKQRDKAHNKSAMMETDVDRRSLFYNSLGKIKIIVKEIFNN